jgi:hypothetical protein
MDCIVSKNANRFSSSKCVFLKLCEILKKRWSEDEKFRWRLPLSDISAILCIIGIYFAFKKTQKRRRDKRMNLAMALHDCVWKPISDIYQYHIVFQKSMKTIFQNEFQMDFWTKNFKYPPEIESVKDVSRMMNKLDEKNERRILCFDKLKEKFDSDLEKLSKFLWNHRKEFEKCEEWGIIISAFIEKEVYDFSRNQIDSERWSLKTKNEIIVDHVVENYESLRSAVEKEIFWNFWGIKIKRVCIFFILLTVFRLI